MSGIKEPFFPRCGKFFLPQPRELSTSSIRSRPCPGRLFFARVFNAEELQRGGAEGAETDGEEGKNAQRSQRREGRKERNRMGFSFVIFASLRTLRERGLGAIGRQRRG